MLGAASIAKGGTTAMTSALDQIEHIFILMMENRSFDHMLGYLSLPPYNVISDPAPHSRMDVEGIRQAWQSGYKNVFQEVVYSPVPRVDPAVPVDPPHERKDICAQLGNPISMQGFVESYAGAPNLRQSDYSAVVGFYTPAEVPMAHFLAQNYMVCDHWFACLPTSTQPNRLMAMSGYAMRDFTAEWPQMQDQDIVYDWLKRNNVSWRVYSETWPLFMLMPKVRDIILFEDLITGRFRSFDLLKRDLFHAKDFPQVTFIEPNYTCLHLDSGDDDHPITSVTQGQHFLSRVYDAVTSNADIWGKSVLIVTYDEHGGFFDHVPPITFTTELKHGEIYAPFKTSGVRVPAIVVSPFVESASTFNGPLDHTSFLKLLADKFTPGHDYSDDVKARTPFKSLSDLPWRDSARIEIPPQPPLQMAHAMARSLASLPAQVSPNGRALRNALDDMQRREPEAVARRLTYWPKPPSR
jgi:phospholipase C